MAIIIPSKSIYEKKNEKILANVVKTAVVPLQELEKKSGNILSEEISFNFSSYNEDYNGIVINYKRPTAENQTTGTINGVDFIFRYFEPIKNNYGTVVVPERFGAFCTLTIPVSNMALLEINEEGYFSNANQYFQVQDNAIFADGTPQQSNYNVRNKLKENTVGYEITEYDEEKNTITVDFGFIIKYSTWVDETNEKGEKERNLKFLWSENLSLSLISPYYEAKQTETTQAEQSDGIFVAPTNNLMQKDFGISSLVLSEYKNGKETATITCSIADFYDESGNLVISKSKEDLPMTFKVGDQVMPMYYSSDGTDKPISLYEDGSPKAFRVVKTKVYYDGAVWQQLYLQEV